MKSILLLLTLSLSCFAQSDPDIFAVVISEDKVKAEKPEAKFGTLVYFYSNLKSGNQSYNVTFTVNGNTVKSVIRITGCECDTPSTHYHPSGLMQFSESTTVTDIKASKVIDAPNINIKFF